jgi:hypothetical protein
MDSVRLAEQIINYYNGNRGKGHTTLVIEGAKNTDCLILTSSYHQGKMVGYETDKIVSAERPDGLLGKDKPLAIDHHVIIVLLGALLYLISDLQHEIIELKSKAKN